VRLADAARVPLWQRAAAARYVIATSSELGTDERKAILALAIWPNGHRPGRPPAPYGRCEWEPCSNPLPEPKPPSPRRRFCSRLCAAQARQDARRPQPRECEGCGVVFTPAQSDGRYCTRQCYERAWRRRRREAHAAQVYDGAIPGVP
jgi:hypothetical protein